MGKFLDEGLVKLGKVLGDFGGGGHGGNMIEGSKN